MLNLKLFLRYIFNFFFNIVYVCTLESRRRCWTFWNWGPGRCRSGNQTQTSKKAANSRNCWAVFAAHRFSGWLHFAHTVDDWLPRAGLTLHRCPFIWVGVAFSFPLDSTDDAWILKQVLSFEIKKFNLEQKSQLFYETLNSIFIFMAQGEESREGKQCTLHHLETAPRNDSV